MTDEMGPQTINSTLSVSSYSLDVQITAPPAEGVYLLLGAAIGVLLSCVLYALQIAKSDLFEPQKVQTGLYIVGTTIIGILAICRKGEPKVISRLMLILLGVGAVSIYWNALEIVWSSPKQSYFLIGGLMPSSDADSWLSGGWRLLEQGSISESDQRRPLNAAIHALRLFVAGSLQSSLLLSALGSGLATLFVAYVIKRSVGWIALGVFLTCAFWLIRDHLPLAMTEVHGFIFGCFAFGCLWQASISRSKLLFTIGLSLLSIGLNARSGPFFVLPMVLVWGVFNLSQSRRFSPSAMMVGTLAIFTGFVVSTLFSLLWGSAQNIQHANFSLTLYGMAVGGKGWLQAFSDYPELLGQGFGSGNESAIAKFLFAEALTKIIENPSWFFGYYISEIREFLVLFIKYDLGVSRVAMLVAGIWILLRCSDRLAQLGILVFLGILLSAPFLMEDAGVRPFAIVYPVFALIPALAIGYVVRVISAKGNTSMSPIQKRIWPDAIAVTGIFCLTATIVGPLVTELVYKSPTTEVGGCPNNSKELQMNSYSSAYVNVVPNSKTKVRVPDIHYSHFLRTFPRSQGEAKRAQLATMTPPFTLVYGYDRNSNSKARIVLDGHVDIEARDGFTICVESGSRDAYPSGQLVGVQKR